MTIVCTRKSLHEISFVHVYKSSCENKCLYKILVKIEVRAAILLIL